MAFRLDTNAVNFFFLTQLPLTGGTYTFEHIHKL